MSDWVIAVKNVLKHEGGLSDHPNDPGDITNFGISLRFIKAAGLDIDDDEHINKNDILALTKQRAKEIYKQEWWDRYHYGCIENQDIANKVLDMSVNMGPKRAHKILQTSINRLREKPITIDGIIGNQTFQAIQKLHEDGESCELLGELRDNSAHFYINLVADNPALRAFLRGWLNRAAL